LTLTGCDILAGGGLEESAVVGLLANAASVSSSFIHVKDIIADSSLDLSRIFGPQHGFTGHTQANMIEWEGYRDNSLGIPVYSLYGRARQPQPEMLEGLDTVIIDLPDIGARPYTYIWTALLMMQSCAAAGIKIVVLDRPNPVGGTKIEGPLLEKGFHSFVGLYPLPLRHGMTLGEILSMINSGSDRKCELEIVRMQGWERRMYFADTGLPWIPPSPNIPTPESALLYQGMVLLEGTNISEGRGTTKPFEIFGAPWIEPGELVSSLNSRRLPGAVFRPVLFQPTFDKYSCQNCGGAQIHVTDPELFQPVRCAVSVILAAATIYPERFRWTDPPYEYEEEKAPIDILYGADTLRKMIGEGGDLDTIAGSWGRGEREFAKKREEYLLYG
jgi:uncharacterized protein YbbC (DUF1343 family)